MFAAKCDNKFKAGIYNFSDVIKAKEYLKKLKKNKKQKNTIYYILIDKMNIIIDEITSYYNATLNIVNKTMNVCDYIIDLIRKKNLTDQLLIARCAYIELSKYLYYDISYNKVKDENIKKLIVEAPINPKTEKYFLM